MIDKRDNLLKEIFRMYLEKEGVNATVVNLRTVSPLPMQTLNEVCAGYKVLVTLEDGVLHGGVGQNFATELSGGARVLIKAHKNGVVPQGTLEELYRLCGLDSETITREILEQLSKEK